MIETLYKRTAIGIYSFEITVTQSIKGTIISSNYGLVNGKKIRHIVEGTVSKFNSIVKKKRQEGYKSLYDVGAVKESELFKLLPVYNTDSNNDYKVMNCKKFVPDKFDYSNGAHGQPKINGNRATIRWGMSQNGLFSVEKPIIKSHEGIIYNIGHIEEVFKEIFKYCPKDTVFDGEIDCYGELVTSISGACRNPSNLIHKNLIYHCFDLAIPDVDQTTRLEMKHSYLRKYHRIGVCEPQLYIHQYRELSNTTVIDVFDCKVYNDDDASELRNLCIEAGYEGAVIRNASATYRFGSRPMIIMKLKKPIYGKFKVLDVIKYGNTDDNNVGVGCKFVLRNDINSNAFESVPLGTAKERLEMYKNRESYIGTEVTIKYFERTLTKVPFHSNVVFD